MNGSDVLKTFFGEEISNGLLRITLGTSKENEVIEEYIDQGEFYSMLINNDEMPLTYEIESTIFVDGEFDNKFEVIVAVTITIIALAFIYIIFKFKLDGLISVFTMIAGFALLSLAIKYTNVEVSLNSFIALIILTVLNVYLITKMLNKIKENALYETVANSTIKVYLENIEVIICSVIIAIVFTFMKTVSVYSFGMTLFYGIISMAISNLLFLRTILLRKYSDK
ncbi:MAG: hypothetical protein HFJ50_03770 [Clostridia bacterium]|nr:hypothetical protein [Clostridia bacterium]